MCGISDLSLAIPSCYLSIEDFAKQKEIDYQKLKLGLGLEKMSVLDADEDVITLAADALIDLLSKNPQVNYTNLKRLYVGTESQIDGSKPIASYVLGISNQYFRSQGLPAIEECDVTDQVFACIGAVDALENCLLWQKQNPNDYAIVIATDNAKYKFNSTGEYTQGAGAVAMLLSSKPSLLAINTNIGVSSVCVHDFFKPLRNITNDDSIEQTQLAQGNGGEYSYLQLHSDCPVYDGPYSNQSYKDRIQSAYSSFKQNNPKFSIKKWDRMIFHLPYAFQARKVAVPFFLEHLESFGKKNSFLKEHHLDECTQDSQLDKLIRKTPEYQDFINSQIADGEIASGQVGNIYSGSIFLSMMSMLYYSYQKENQLSDRTIGLIAYGSGAKSKVLEGTVKKGWQNIVCKFNLREKLDKRIKISFETYKKHYFNKATKVSNPEEKQVLLNHIGIGESNYGARNYKYMK